MAQNDIGIDLGTTTIIIAQEGQGVVLNQPSVVAVDTRKNCVLEAGDKALAMVGRTPNYISAIFPLKDGVISDHTMTRELICRFVNQVYSSHMVKPRVAVCVPAAITGIESDAVVEAVMAAGARQVYLIDEPIAAALGSGIDITVPDGRMIIDIGGGTTDIAVLSLGGKVKATSVRVGQRTAESLKKNVACCPQKADFNETMEIKGRSLLTGLPVRVNVSTADLYEPVMRLSEQIGTAAHQVLEKTPPELAGDIYRNGVVLTGGGAQLHGLPEYLSQELKVEVTVSPDPVNCVALGTAMSLRLGDKLETGFMDATPRMGRR
ncbi:MAG: rod shape-determining protein [Faecalibacterium prausnitzii]|uniref:Cell shape-determining protein MreB n=1 Tax=Faecalibacterium prausnitzii TaxID=853 RepID=A0A943FWA0_9FIRM|nr:rod shape-determining protein [Faecalibacterium prausnitzii]